MRRNFWDNVRRNQNARKQDYWEDWTFDKVQEAIITKVDKAETSRFHLTQVKPSVLEAKTRLKSFGVTGRKLSETIRAIMKDEISMAWVEYGLYFEQLIKEGFVQLPIDQQQNGIMIARFVRYSTTGDVEDGAQFTFSKPL